MQKLTVPEICEALMSLAEDECIACGGGHDVAHDDDDFWHIRDGVRRECRAHQLHRAIKRFEALEGSTRRM